MQIGVDYMTYWTLIPQDEVLRYHRKTHVLQQLTKPKTTTQRAKDRRIKGFLTKKEVIQHMNNMNVPNAMRPKGYVSCGFVEKPLIIEKNPRSREVSIKIPDNWEWNESIIPQLEERASNQGMSVSALLRKILYNYYNYTSHGKRQMRDMYSASDELVLPVELEFFWEEFIESVARRKGGMKQTYRAAVEDAIIHYLTGEVVVH